MACLTLPADFRARRDGRRKTSGPRCPVHECFLIVESTQGRKQYLYCPIAGCRQSAKKIRSV